MDSWPLYLVLLLFHTSSELEVTGPASPHTVLVGSRVLLPCRFSVDTPPVNPIFLAVFWKFGDKELLKYDKGILNYNKDISSRLRMTIDGQAAMSGDVSLTIDNVTISDKGIYTCSVIYSPDRQEKEIELHVQASPKVKIMKKSFLRNEENRLHCSITDFYPSNIKVSWFKNGQILITSDTGKPQRNSDGTYMVNSSVIITPAETQDNMIIECQVEHESLVNSIKDNYTVVYGVVPKVQIFSSRRGEDQEQVFFCDVQGFYPEAMTVNWLLNRRKIEIPSKNADGSFNKESYYRVQSSPDNQVTNISCEVQHETLMDPVIKTLRLPREDEDELGSSTTSLMAAILGSFLVTVAVSLAVFYKKIYKDRGFQQFLVSPIYMPEMWGEDRKVTLYCTASNCPKKVQVTWTVTDADGQSVMMSDRESEKEKLPSDYTVRTDQSQADGQSFMIPDEVIENERLLSDYTVRTDQSQTDRMHNVITALNITPSVSKHRDTKIVCKFICDGKTKERKIKWKFQLPKPQIADENPIKLSLCDSGDVLCSASLQNFSPKDIQITWSCGVGHYQDLETFKETVIVNSQQTFDADSECRIPGDLFKEPGFKVRLHWRHESMDGPKWREVSATDLPWRPQIGDIIIQDWLHSAEAKLQCTISGYFPDNLDVKWFRREPGKQELYLVSPSEKYKLPVMDVTRQEDRTYTCTASLIVTVSRRTDHGAEFICQVGHPSMERPLERRTGELSVKGIPLIGNFVQMDRYISLDVDSFYPKDITITWSRAWNNPEDYKRIPDSSIQNTSHQNNDRTYRLTSRCEGLTLIDRANPNGIFLKLMVDHDGLQSPLVHVFLRLDGNYYLLQKGQKKFKLPKLPME
ncbi:signal-regulatory beta-1-like isoform X3 [Pelobates cultripes]|uniref:Signal-regulatory beta-1-like isoform X3 n=1 Tax=Pelobates cultripes TaxID=61616 RepID=A0AAD1SVM1_PELCU|nr:signal-regulatory beta-1-like isoform X3 [Pelobates cultripes]